jgi:hypothetical protein
VTCKLWDQSGHDEPSVKRDPSGKRRLVPPPWAPPAEAA